MNVSRAAFELGLNVKTQTIESHLSNQTSLLFGVVDILQSTLVVNYRSKDDLCHFGIP